MKATHNALLNRLEVAIRGIERVSNVQRARLLTEAAETLRGYQEELPSEVRAQYARPDSDIAALWLGMAREVVTCTNHEVVTALTDAVETLRVSRFLLDRYKARAQLLPPADLRDMKRQGSA